MQQKFACPVEKIAFAGFAVRGGFELVYGADKVSILFFDFGEKVVEFGGVFDL